MAYWMVYQGASWARARLGGYLWAPKQGNNGQTYVYWTNMAEVAPGDMIFSGVQNALRAFSQAVTPAYAANRPDPRDEANWELEGWRMDVAYTDLPQPLYYRDWVPSILSELPQKHSPFSGQGRPNQGYLYHLPSSVGEYLVALVGQDGVSVDLAASIASQSAAEQETVRQQLTQARIGQGKFRQDLIDRWKACAVLGVSRPELLRASHIKPWSSCNNVERLDPANGLLLSATYDAAFDAKLISFTDAGDILLAPDFPRGEAIAAGIDPASRIEGISSATKAYLAQHREIMAAQSRRRARKALT